MPDKEHKLHLQIELILASVHSLVRDNTHLNWQIKLAAVRNLAKSSGELDSSLAEFLSWFDNEVHE